MEEEKFYYPEERRFTRAEIEELLKNAKGRTLEEVDVNKVFIKTIDKPKITGIAGDVIEQSVLGYKSNRDQYPDIIIDDKYETEVKTTGIKRNKGSSEFLYQAKEPASVTAVSIDNIVDEAFESSHFWRKLKYLLFVYYIYSSDKTVLAEEYKNFVIEDYQFYEFSNQDKLILKSDWETVRDFIIKIRKENIENPEKQYHRISSELRSKLLYIDTAPKYPKSPRFRLKKSVVSSIYFEKEKKRLSKIKNMSSYEDLDEKLRKITELYEEKTVEELLKIFNIKVKNINKLDKSIGEKIVLKMFGSKASKLNNIDFFLKVGIKLKTICLSTKNKRTEDTKLFLINFDEMYSKNEDKQETDFYESEFYDYFNNNKLLCIIFKETGTGLFKDNIFKGFKKITFEDELIDNDSKKTWDKIRELVVKNELKESVVIKKDGTIAVNKNGVIKTRLNFPKSSNYTIFVRGSGKNSAIKPLTINNINMYYQYIWIKGSYLVEKLEAINYIK